jgi:hypothetical protein
MQMQKPARLEDGGLGVAVDGDDALGVLHARQVLDGARDAERNVQVWRDHLARLPHLQQCMACQESPQQCRQGTTSSES